jgi:hypothetical protein
MVAKKRLTPLPPAIIPFILQHLEGFDIMLEGDERIIITPKADATMDPGSMAKFASTLLEHKARILPGKPTASILRPRFIYKVADRKLTPEQAQRFGFSSQRHQVYKAVFDAPKGVQAKNVMEATGLPHGTVQQVLHWLRKRKLITGEPETM